MTVTVTLRERGSNAFLELRSLFIQIHQKVRMSMLKTGSFTQLVRNLDNDSTDIIVVSQTGC